MDAIVENCCGLDVHQKTVVACVIITGERRRAKREVRTFRTVMKDLLALRDWLASLGVTHVGMESTGVYWVPVFRVLEGRFELVVGNATHIKKVPGVSERARSREQRADRARCVMGTARTTISQEVGLGTPGAEDAPRPWAERSARRK